MAFRDLREFLARLESEGEVIRIEEEVDWNLEAGAILRRAYERNLPAPLFEKIRGYPPGYALFSGGVSNYQRSAIALGMDRNTHPRELVEEYLKRKQKPISPLLVNDGPCKENIHLGDEADLLEFPVPLIHQGDGGRYIGTWHLTISKDATGQWVNWGMYRHMVHDSSAMGIMTAGETQHLASMYHRQYEPRNEPMAVAVVIGVDPVLTFCALSPLPYGVSEVDIAGAIRGEPVELVKCETVDLAVPASAEIVIEGVMVPGDTKAEGPFGEYTGYVGEASIPRQVIRVKAVTHRNNPILTFCCQGIPITDSCISSIGGAAEVLDAFRLQGLPVTAVSVPPEAANLLTVVAVRKLYAGVVDDISHAASATNRARRMPYLIIVDDDVDPFNIAEVLHALVSKCHPYRGIVRLERSHTAPLMPFLDRQERKYGLGAKAYFDCTWPSDRYPDDVPKRASFAEVYPPEVQQKSLATWRKHGYG